MQKKLIKSNIYSYFLWLTMLLVAGSLPFAAMAAAIVTDLTGKVSTQAGGKTVAVAILSEIEPNARVQLEPGSTLVVLYTRSGDEFVADGPALIHFRPDAPVALSGAAPRKRTSAIGKDAGIRIRPAAATQAAFVMRSARATARIRLLTLSGTRVLEDSPEFLWQGIEGVETYRFELTDETGKSLYETGITGSRLKLPDTIRLQAGAGYTWELSTRASDGRRYVSAGDFSLASADLQSRAAVLRPAADAPVSDRVAYAAWLAQMELRDEARRYWRALAKERPEDPGLRALAAH
jgi:hypothetical protein